MTTEFDDTVYVTFSHTSALLIQEALEAGMENTQELLIEHDQRLGRTTRGNKWTAERLESEIARMKEALEIMKS